MIHGSIKPENVLLSNEGMIKLCDINLNYSVRSSTDEGKVKQFVDPFMAPETFKNPPIVSQAVDVWGIGAILYYYCYGVPPFTEKDSDELKRKICEEEPEFPPKVLVNEEVMQLIKSCLIKDPKERMTLESIMESAWVTNDGRYSLYNEEYEMVEVGSTHIKGGD